MSNRIDSKLRPVTLNDQSPHRQEPSYGKPEIANKFDDELRARQLAKQGPIGKKSDALSLTPELERDLTHDLRLIADYIEETRTGFASLSEADQALYGNNAQGEPTLQAYSRFRTGLDEAMRAGFEDDQSKKLK